jgi:hypothetical protein
MFFYFMLSNFGEWLVRAASQTDRGELRDFFNVLLGTRVICYEMLNISKIGPVDGSDRC